MATRINKVPTLIPQFQYITYCIICGLIGAIVVYLHLNTVILSVLVFLALIIFLVVIKNPVFGWILFALFLPWVNLRVEVGSFSITPSILILAPIFISTILQKKLSLKITKNELIISELLMLYIFTEIFFATTSGLQTWSISLVIKTFIGIIIYYFFAKGLKDKWLSKYIFALLTSTAIYVITAIIYYIFIHKISYISTTFNLSYGATGRNELAILFPLVMPFALSKFILEKNKDWITRSFHILIATIILIGIILSLSRGAYVNTIFGLFWVLIWSGKARFRSLFRKSTIILGLVFSLSLAIIWINSGSTFGRFLSFAELINKNIDTQGASTGYSVNIRRYLYQQAWNLWVEKPIFGIGSGEFQSIMARDPNVGDASPTHNEYLRWIVEYGIIGFIPLLLFIGFHIWKIFKILRRQRKKNQLDWLIVGISGSFISLLIQALFINYSSHYFFWITFGLVGKVILDKSESRHQFLEVKP